MVTLATVAGDITDAVVWVAVIAGSVGWHWINRRYPDKWNR